MDGSLPASHLSIGGGFIGLQHLCIELECRPLNFSDLRHLFGGVTRFLDLAEVFLDLGRLLLHLHVILNNVGDWRGQHVRDVGGRQQSSEIGEGTHRSLRVRAVRGLSDVLLEVPGAVVVVLPHEAPAHQLALLEEGLAPLRARCDGGQGALHV